MKSTKLVRLFTVSALAVVTLSGCETWQKAVNYVRADNQNVCPDAQILANTSVIPVYDPAKGADPSNIVYTMQMTGIKTRCDYSKRDNTTDVNLRIAYKATRAPGGEAAHFKAPYYVAVTTDGNIVDKQVHWLEFDFPQSAAVVTGEEYMDSVVIKVAPQKRSFEYHVLTGFQLTQAQIEYNKKMGQYLP
ncbi:hypothetical protein FHS83_002687 [Rhizomicrobium palustre]|uniref:Lipoprotein n=1 Tax=Rhizomicrobium palustre TaxID=189966 RepID=A0A846N1K4_9PROT|nr:hypothetical protein [Rhizomicrobium palustre]NIK89369.1 hypothetical protein [Rhizomicrobium palustre]